MKDKHEITDWVNEVMKSTDSIKRVASNPFLYEKIMFRMQNTGGVILNKKGFTFPAWSAWVLFFILLNVSVIYFQQRQKVVEGNKSYSYNLVNEFNQQTTYQY
jgi:cell division septal protein FtsQ